MNLTEREWQVARLVATGIGNEEIARALRASIRTVEAHIRSIVNKTGIHGRRSIAEWYVAHVVERQQEHQQVDPGQVGEASRLCLDCERAQYTRGKIGIMPVHLHSPQSPWCPCTAGHDRNRTKPGGRPRSALLDLGQGAHHPWPTPTGAGREAVLA